MEATAAKAAGRVGVLGGVLLRTVGYDEVGFILLLLGLGAQHFAVAA